MFITISLIMGDGLYNLCKVMLASLKAYVQLTQRPALPPTTDSDSPHSPQTQALSTKLDCPVGGRGGNGVSIYGSAEGGCKRAKAEEEEGGEEGHHLHSHSHSRHHSRHPTADTTGTHTTNTLSQPLLQQESGPTPPSTTNPAAAPSTTAATTGAEPPCPRPSTPDASSSSSAPSSTLPHASRESRLEHALRTHVFVTDVIPGWVSAGGYLAFGAMGALVIPLCYPVVK